MDLHQARSGLRHHHLTPAEINAWDPLLDQKKLKPIGPIGKTYIQYLGTKENLPSKLEFFSPFSPNVFIPKKKSSNVKAPPFTKYLPVSQLPQYFLGEGLRVGGPICNVQGIQASPSVGNHLLCHQIIGRHTVLSKTDKAGTIGRSSIKNLKIHWFKKIPIGLKLKNIPGAGHSEEMLQVKLKIPEIWSKYQCDNVIQDVGSLAPCHKTSETPSRNNKQSCGYKFTTTHSWSENTWCTK